MSPRRTRSAEPAPAPIATRDVPVVVDGATVRPGPAEASDDVVDDASDDGSEAALMVGEPVHAPLGVPLGAAPVAGTRRYEGLPWRAQFLRAPKLAAELAGRPEFAQVRDLARVALGLKTGADKFFFVRRADVEDDPASDAAQGVLLPRRGRVPIVGMDGWRGDVDARDLLPALLNPREMFRDDAGAGRRAAAGRAGGAVPPRTVAGRRFRVPGATPTLYLYPRAMARGGRGAADLFDYIGLAEDQGVHEQSLVQANGDEHAWYRQTRTVLRSPWALPYNSAFEYGAWDNGVGAVLNGRIVGAAPRPDIESDLLGAALNSTFALLGRLRTGVAHGAEAALDVGPPALREVWVPDVRRLDPAGTPRVLAALGALRRHDTMPPAPGSDLGVPDARRELDVALLAALGLSEGQAVALASRTYEAYARWRGDAEELERVMRGNRTETGRAGRSRGARPADIIGRRVWDELQPDTPLFPSAYLRAGEPVQAVALPRGARLPDSAPLLDPGVIAGERGRSVDLGAYERVAYVGMLKTLNFPAPYAVPLDPVRAGAIADAFTRAQTAFIQRARDRARAGTPRASDVTGARTVAEKLWAAACRAAGMQPPRAATPAGLPGGDVSDGLPLAPVLQAPVAGPAAPEASLQPPTSAARAVDRPPTPAGRRQR